jgi:L-aminopeptidase/D-esterase-like protein
MSSSDASSPLPSGPPSGPLNSLTDVAGLRVGHWSDSRRPTGCTVVLCPEGAVAAVDVRGAAPGTRETDLLDPVNTVDRVHGIVLSGGSAFGLDAAQGVVQWLRERGHGLPVGPARVPIVPAAILFDLWMGDATITPDAAAGWAACESASAAEVALGSVGAGAGATVGKCFGMAHAMKGGIGSASVRLGPVTVAALIAVNAVGDVRDPQTGALLAGALTPEGQRLRNTSKTLMTAGLQGGGLPGRHEATTIGVIATDAALDKVGCKRLARVAHDGLARAIDPVHTAWDGDTLFALSTGRLAASAHPVSPMTLEIAAAWVTAQAILRAVQSATRVEGPGVPALPARRELF